VVGSLASPVNEPSAATDTSNGRFREARETSSFNPVGTNSEAEDVRSPHFAAVVLDLLVALESALGREQVGAEEDPRSAN